MERELWRVVRWALRRLPRRRPVHALYDNREILAVYLWAVLHDRSVLWATVRNNWPVQAWKRRLPDQSTMSRRLRDPLVITDFERLLDIIQRRLKRPGSGLIVDGKPLIVSEFTLDKQAAIGWGTGRMCKGYKLHALIDDCWRILAFEIRPMNDSEQAVACGLVQRAHQRRVLPVNAELLADASYDSRHLYKAADDANIRLVTQRRFPHTSVQATSHPHRVEAIKRLEQEPGALAIFKKRRVTVEHFFGALASAGGGLHALPPWARGLRRASLWTAAKLVLFSVRNTRRHPATA